MHALRQVLLGTKPPSRRALSFASASSQHLTRAWGSTGGGNKKFSIAVNYKRASTGANMYFCAGGENSSNNEFELRFENTDQIRIRNSSGGSTNMDKLTTATFTDTSTMHSLLLAIDMDQSASADRIRLYVDSSEVTSWATNTVPAAGTTLAWDSYNTTYYIGRLNFAAGSYFNGTMDDFVHVGLAQLTPPDVFSANRPIPYAGSYGSKGFRLNFEDAASTTTLGLDTSGNGNNWTLNSMTTANSVATAPGQ